MAKKSKQKVPKIKCKYDKLMNPKLLKPNPRNPNEHGQDQIELLASSMKHYGFYKPIIVSKQSGFINTGHGTVLAAIRAGFDSIPVEYQDFKNLEEEYGQMTMDNASQQWSQLNFGKIKLEIEGFSKKFDPKMLGLREFSLDLFDKNDIDGGTTNINEEWKGMPEFTQEDKTAHKTVALHFHDQKAVEKFAKLIDQKITDKTRTIWYPTMIIEKAADKRYGRDKS